MATPNPWILCTVCFRWTNCNALSIYTTWSYHKIMLSVLTSVCCTYTTHYMWDQKQQVKQVLLYKLQLGIPPYTTTSMEVYCGQYYQNIFSWAKYKIFKGKHKFQWPKTARFHSQHVFIVKTCYVLANIFMGKVQHFHWQSTTYSWANWIACRMRAPRMCCWVNKMITGQSCEKSHVYQLRVDNALPATSLGSSSRVLHFGIHLMGVHGLGWFWTKASLPSRRGRINLKSAVSVRHTHTVLFFMLLMLTPRQWLRLCLAKN